MTLTFNEYFQYLLQLQNYLDIQDSTTVFVNLEDLSHLQKIQTLKSFEPTFFGKSLQYLSHAKNSDIHNFRKSFKSLNL